MANRTSSISYEPRAASPVRNTSYSISPQTLALADKTLQIAAATAVGYKLPVATLHGVLCGALWQRIVSNHKAPEDSESTKGRRIVSIFFTGLATLSAFALPKAQPYAAFYLGVSAALSTYELVRKSIG